jgi:hypothetical protein
MLPARHQGGAALVAVWLMFAGCAGTNPAARQVNTLNDEALRDYEQGRPQKAKDRLIAALAVARDKGMEEHPATARTRMNLGVVYAGGFKQRAKAVVQMTRALETEPRLRVPKRFLTPPVQRAFELAARRAKPSAGKVEGKKVAANVTMAVAVKPEPAPEKPETARDEGTAKPETAKNVAKVDLGSKAPPADAKGKPVRDKSEAKGADKADAGVAKVDKKVPATVAINRNPPAPDPADLEADVPMPPPEPVYCPLPDEVPPAKDVAVWCAIGPEVKPRAASLLVRAQGQTDFTRLTMKRSQKGWYVATIAADVIKGSLVQYYVEAEGPRGDPLAATGDFGSPNLLLIRAGAPAVEGIMTARRMSEGDDVGESPGSTSSENENPLALDDPEVIEDEMDGPVEGPRWWVGLQVGTGWAVHGDAELEFRTGTQAPGGLTFAGLAHALPELSYRWSPRWTFGLQTRHQLIVKEGTTGGLPGSPASGANAVLLRALYKVAAWKKLDLFGSGSLGGGEGFRMVFGPSDADARTGTDTARGGPVLFGPGGGVAYAIAPPWTFVFELRALVGAPDFAVLGEIDTGLRYGF